MPVVNMEPGSNPNSLSKIEYRKKGETKEGLAVFQVLQIGRSLSM